MPAGFVGTGLPAESVADIKGARGAVGWPEIWEVGVDNCCGSGWRMAHSCSPVYLAHQDGGVAGASPAEGGVPAISAPARGKAFPHTILPTREMCCCYAWRTVCPGLPLATPTPVCDSTR